MRDQGFSWFTSMLENSGTEDLSYVWPRPLPSTPSLTMPSVDAMKCKGLKTSLNKGEQLGPNVAN